VGILKGLLRFYSYIFEGLLALFAAALACVSLASQSPLNLGFLPWQGPRLAYVLLFSSLAGLLAVLIATGGKLRPLFFLWSVVVFAVLLRGFFLTSYKFAPPVTFKPAAYLTVGAFLGMIGAFPWPRRPGPMRRPEKW
jgi:hypothetical protein